MEKNRIEWNRVENKREVEDEEVQWRGERDGKGKERQRERREKERKEREKRKSDRMEKKEKDATREGVIFPLKAPCVSFLNPCQCKQKKGKAKE